MAILTTCTHILGPVVKFLLKFGISYREFAETAKKVFVDVASSEFGVRGRPTNISRTAVLTGLTRKQVKRIREQEILDEMGTTNMSQASLVLAGWHSDVRFLQPASKSPRELFFDKGRWNFCDLVKEYGRDVPPRAMLKELTRTGAVVVRDNELLQAVSRTNLSTDSDSESIRRAGAVLHHMAGTVMHNLITESSGEKRFERRAFTTKLKPQHLSAFKKFVEIEGQRFLEQIDDWITLHEAYPKEVSQQDVVGVGVYLFEERDSSTV